MSELYRVSVPGSLMLLGEYAVLHGSSALVCAIDKRIILELRPRQDKNVKLVSNLGTFNFNLDELSALSIIFPWEYVLTAIKAQQELLVSGFEISIQSEFSHTVGFGSSAAVTVATLAVLRLWLKQQQIDKMQLLLQAREVVHKVQGMSSGADLAASIFGGVVLYKMSSLAVQRIADYIPLVVVYSGSKMPTKKVVAQVQQLQIRYPKIVNQLFSSIDHCVSLGADVLKTQNWQKFGEIMNVHHGLQVALGTSNLLLEELVFAIRTIPRIFGAKISGAGLGDCVIGCGEMAEGCLPENEQQKEAGIKQIAVKVSKQGICYF